MPELAASDFPSKTPSGAQRQRALGRDVPSDKPSIKVGPLDNDPQILKPYHRDEAITIGEASAIAGRSVRTIREWCARFDIGRRIGGQWAVSKVALAMLLDGNAAALAAYLAGDRGSQAGVAYFERCGVPILKRENSFREEALSEPNSVSVRESA